MPISGYFGVQDAIVIIIAASMAFSLIRRNPEDPTRWIPRNNMTALRWAVGVAIVVATLYTIGRSRTVADYFISMAGAVLFLAGAVFFYGAKSPLSSVLVEDKEHGASLLPKGLYRYVRHPLFFGLFLCSVGFPLYLISIPGLVVSFAASLPLLLHSSKMVDAFWSDRAGEEYGRYKSDVHLFMPSLKSVWKK